jgi:hypothetical protein
MSQKSRTVLSESSNKANVQSKKVAGSAKDSGVAGNKSAGSENQGSYIPTKRTKGSMGDGPIDDCVVDMLTVM